MEPSRLRNPGDKLSPLAAVYHHFKRLVKESKVNIGV